MSFCHDRYLTQEEVRVLSLRRPFHKFTERQSPVREGGAAEKSAETKSWRTILRERAGVRPSSLVHKVFAQEVHLRHRGHVDLDFLVSSFLPEVFHRPPVQAGSESDASQHSWSALWRTERGQETLLETLKSSTKLTRHKHNLHPVRVMWHSDHCSTCGI